MSLTSDEFEEAIEAVGRVWQTALSDSDADELEGAWEGSWDDVRVCESFGTRFLRIVKHVPERTSVFPPTRMEKHLAAESEAELEEQEEVQEEDDPEALPILQAQQNPPTERAVSYDIIHSPSYQVPVLYLTFTDLSRNKSLPLPSPDEIYELLVPEDVKAPMRHVGVMGALSMAEHPVSGMPAYFVHPCRTQGALAPLLVGESDKMSLRSSKQMLEYLMLWFGVIGASVGLSVPVGFATRLAEKGSELRRC